MKKKCVLDYENQKCGPRKWPEFGPGDTVAVKFKIEEGGKERVQIFTGTCIGQHNGGLGETFTVRKITQGYGIERNFPLHSPLIVDLQVEKFGAVRRAKLYYLRKRSGRSTRITERLDHEAKAGAPGAEQAHQAQPSTGTEQAGAKKT